MYRALILAVLGLFSVFASVCGKQIEVEPTELLPWPILSATVPAEAVPVFAEPQEDLQNCDLWRDQAQGFRCVFGLLPVGSSPDPGISFAVIETDPPTLVMDLNNDEILSHDEAICCEYRQRIGPRSYTWYPLIHVEYVDGDVVTASPAIIQFTALYSHSNDSLAYAFGPFCQRRGNVNLGDVTSSISLTTLSPTLRYDDFSQLLITMDTDGDGVLNSLPGSHEVFSFTDSVQVGTAAYRIVSVSADGTRAELELAGEVPPRFPIARNVAAPNFQTTDLFGDDLELADLRGSVVVLLFFPQLVPPNCETCAEIASSAFYSRLEAILDDLEALAVGAQVIVIVANEISYQTLSLLPQGTTRYVHDTRVNDLYRRAYGAVVIDQNGIIRALDEAWSTFACDRPTGSYKILRPSEIAAVVARLLRQEP